MGNDFELLKAFEPVLRFVAGEQFYPVRVEDFIEANTRLFRHSGLRKHDDLTGQWQQHAQQAGTSLADALGHPDFRDYRHYLQYVQPDTLIRRLKENALWLAILIGASLFFIFVLGWSWAKVTATALILLPILLLSSNKRVFLGGFLIVMSIVTSFWIGRFIGPLTGFAIGLVCVIALLISFASLLPGFLLDITSWTTDRQAEIARQKYRRSIDGKAGPYTCYGYIQREGDWTALQYTYFYAFNDWRRAANGLNHHEGDWEAATVFLHKGQPYGVAYSQHYEGAFRLWKDVRKVYDPANPFQPTMHPIMYVAIGSHANYADPILISAPDHLSPGVIQYVLFWLNQRINAANTLLRQILLLLPYQLSKSLLTLLRWLVRSSPVQPSRMTAFLAARTETLEPPRIPPFFTEKACGDGLRIGVPGVIGKEEICNHWAGFLADRRTMTAEELPEWHLIMLNESPGWLEFQGLWGNKSTLPDEAGPPGPKWGRPYSWTDRIKAVAQRLQQRRHPGVPAYCSPPHQVPLPGVKQRIRWARPLDWKDELLRVTVRNSKENLQIRLHALTELAAPADQNALRVVTCLYHALPGKDLMKEPVRQAMDALKNELPDGMPD